jgi:hypothetical protein
MPAEFAASDDLRLATFTDVDLSGATFREVMLDGGRFVGTVMTNVEISGSIEGMRINGVDVAPLVEAELNRRDPDRATVFTASDPDRVRAAWEVIERRWAEAVERARALPDHLRHERVADEWSFTETLRHLIFVTDAWIRRTVLNERDHFCRFGLVHTPMGDPSWMGIDPDASPTFDEVLDIRLDRMRVVRDMVGDLTNEQFYGTCPPNPSPGYPDAAEQLVLVCLAALLNEEWHHLEFATRDLTVLEARLAADGS